MPICIWDLKTDGVVQTEQITFADAVVSSLIRVD